MKLAIVGCGEITRREHLPAALHSSKVRLHALIDTNLDNARTLADLFSLKDCKLSRDLASVINEVEGVLIATPNDSHFPLAQLALSRGIPVLVEKPLTTRFQDAIELCELAEKNHTFISVGYMTRHHENLALLKRLLDSGFLGTIVSFHYEYGFRGGWEPVSGYNLDPQAAGGGVLIVVGSHFVDRMLYLFGRPASFLYADDNHGGVEANCKAEFTFEKPGGRFTGSLFLSKTMRLKNMFILETDRYTCRLVEGQSESLTLHPHNAPELELIAQPREKGPPQGRRSDYALQLEEFATVARRGGQPAVDGWFAAQSVHLLEEMYRNRMPLEEPFQAPWPKRALGVSSRG